MPTISPDGRTYTFQIRDDYAFSPPATGVVTAQSMKYTFERTLHPDMASPALPVLLEHRRRRGVPQRRRGARSRASSRRGHADDHADRAAGRVPDAAGDAVPLRGSDEPAAESSRSRRSPRPAPTTSRADAELAARRQPEPQLPRARGRSASTRSSTRSVTPERGEAASGSSRAISDYGVDFPPAQTRSSRQLYGPDSPAAARGLQQWFSNPANCVGYLPLNTERPLFANANMRKAVNYAHRPHGDGGPSGPYAATPTDSTSRRACPATATSTSTPTIRTSSARASSRTGTGRSAAADHRLLPLERHHQPGPVPDRPRRSCWRSAST